MTNKQILKALCGSENPPTTGLIKTIIGAAVVRVSRGWGIATGAMQALRKIADEHADDVYDRLVDLDRKLGTLAEVEQE